MHKLLLVLAISAIVSNTHQASAQEEQKLGSNPRFDDYYTVSDVDMASEQVSHQDTIKKIGKEIDPLQSAQNLFLEAPEWMAELKAKVLSLLQFDHHNESYGDVNEPYNRSKHFGGWINDKNDDTCYNTRAKVLIRDSKTPVTVSSSGCTVVAGSWDEPYTGNQLTKASDIQIDHFVPLKNTYISGGWRWDFRKRCLYANFLGNSFHLISADGPQNMKKSDRTPEEYMPPNKAYACQYLEQWLKVKLIWELGLTPPEKQAVVSLIEQNHCDLSKFNYSAQDLQQQRAFMADNMNLCQ
ncbi:HNH endonuclease family protein [Bdellovibrio svalbardensis]|uniref:HNH endonuclease family protein n=1 Tax=Bdellovibrio svalbardensis TaxID=2972972 RepID=A0ABT6DIE9_9BACT|nr:HNH endonuclease family protein [Bdellovibrio svalbardensis]MDG0816020.1 HNH endonuclease family protein [Bdellovibrio svalbardensis]